MTNTIEDSDCDWDLIETAFPTHPDISQGQVNIADYHVGTPLQQTGSTLCLVNSTVNPVVYAVYMPRFRKAVRKTLAFCLPKSTKVQPGSSG